MLVCRRTLLGSLCICNTLEVLYLHLPDCSLKNSEVADLCYILQAPRLHTFYLWLTNNYISDIGAQNLFHRIDAAAHLDHVYVDISRNYVGLYGLLMAQEYRNRHTQAEVVYLPRPGIPLTQGGSPVFKRRWSYSPPMQ